MSWGKSQTQVFWFPFAFPWSQKSLSELATTGILNSLQINRFNIVSVPWLGRFKRCFPYVSRAVLAALVSAEEQPQKVTLYSGQNYYLCPAWCGWGKEKTLTQQILLLLAGKLFHRQDGASNCTGGAGCSSEIYQNLLPSRSIFTDCLSVQAPAKTLVPSRSLRNVHPGKKKKTNLLNSHNKRVFNSSEALTVTRLLAFCSL